MELIAWDDSLTIGVEKIDRQHQKLMAMINELGKAIKGGKENAVISEILDELIIYTATHFRTEEQYFAHLGKQEIETHKQEHALCIKMVENFAVDFNRGFADRNLALGTDIMSFLRYWWKYHILETDKKYAIAFREKGLS